VAGIVMGPGDAPLAADEERTWIALLDQAAIAMDRARLNRESALASVAREGEKVQAALLSSLSHDLRTPLASITGAVTSLRQLGDKMPPESRADLLLSIEEEAGRLNRFVANLFDMTRIEAGMMKARREPIDLPAVIEASAARARNLHPDLVIELSLAPDLGKAMGDPVLLEQVLFNLLDNARKYGGAGQPVTIFARADEGSASISVTDQGKGIPEGDLEKIFEKFYRRAKGDGRPAGTGLGLSIARGLMTAMGGTIKATSPALRKRGTRFTLRLPLAPRGN
jgi:two-component system sensor histidine kinase KdpD